MSAEQMQAFMTQIQQLGQLAQEQQLQPMQWQQQAGQQNPAVSPPGLGPPVRARNLLDTRFVKIPFIPGEGKDHEDWATNRTICEILEICDEEFAEQFDEEDVQGHSAEVYDVLGGEVLQLVRTVDDMEGFRAWSKLHRMVGQVTNPLKVKELRDVEGEPMKGKGQGFDQGVRRDLQRHGEGGDRRLHHALRPFRNSCTTRSETSWTTTR